MTVDLTDILETAARIAWASHPASLYLAWEDAPSAAKERIRSSIEPTVAEVAAEVERLVREQVAPLREPLLREAYEAGYFRGETGSVDNFEEWLASKA